MVFSAFFLFLGCEKDEFQKTKPVSAEMETSSSQTSPISTTLIHKDSLRADFPEFFENHQSRPGDSLGNYALSEYGRRFVKEGREYSTFLVTNTPEGGYLENIVFSNGATSERTFLVRYDLTETEKEQIRNWEHVPLEGKIVSFDELEDGTMVERGMICLASFYSVSICVYGNHEDGELANGEDCPGHHEVYILEINCIGGGGVPDGSIPSSFPGTGGGGSSGDGDGPGGPDYEVITIPVVPSPFQLFLTIFLDQTQLDYLENHPQTSIEIQNFLAANSYSAESMAFAEEAIGVLINGGEVDFTNHLKNYDFHAETPEILAFEQDYRDDMSQAEIAIFDNLSRFQQLDYLHSAYLAFLYAEYYFEETRKVQHNGKGDAYRHCLWNALGAAKLGESLIEQLTNAHEIYDPGDTSKPLEKAMDLHNNQVGRNIGSSCNFMLMMEVKFAVEAGQTNYIFPTDINSNVIPGVSQIISTDQ